MRGITVFLVILSIVCAISTDEIVFIGGSTAFSTSPLSSVDVFNTQLGTWRTSASMKMARHYFGGSVLDNYYYVCGGDNGTSYTDTCEKFSIANEQWEWIASMPSLRNFAVQMVAINNSLCVVQGTTNLFQCYNPLTDSWTSLPSSPDSRFFKCHLSLTVSRRYGATVKVGNNVYIFGGFNPSVGVLSTVCFFNWTSQVWTYVQAMPRGLSSASAVVYDQDTIVVTGGVYTVSGTNYPNNNIYKYTISNNSWTFFSNLDAGTYDGSLIRFGNHLLYFGGADSTSSVVVNLMQVVDVTIGSVSSRPIIPNPRWAAGSFYLGIL